MSKLGLHSGFLWKCGILFATIALGCSRAKPEIGFYSGAFYWQDGLKEASLALESDGHPHLDLGYKEVRDQLESLVGQQVTRANLRTARGTIVVHILGGPPFVVSLSKIEIQEPDFSSLLEYVKSENVDQIRQFIERYHDVNQRDLNQGTALCYAAAYSKLKAVQALLVLGADPDLPDSDGQTPLVCAALGGSVEAARLLIQAGAKINPASQGEITPLMWATLHSQYKLLTFLLQSGADPNYVSRDGDSALRIARKYGDRTAIAILQQFGAAK